MKKRNQILSFLLAVALLIAAMPTAFAAVEDTGFTDVSAEADYAQAVIWCRENGLLNGVGNNRFDPDGTLTRAMLATALYRAAGEPAVSGAPAFSDTQAGSWYADAVAWASAQSLILGYGNGRFGTNDSVSVEMLNVILDRYMGRGDTWQGDSALAVPATRAEIAVALYANLAKADETTEGPAESGKTLVVYYSATGSTEAVAGYIADALDADLFAITPAEPYSDADLDYTDSGSRVSQEYADESLRTVELAEITVENWDEYDTVFIGYPIWWGIAAWPTSSFVAANDFSGKTVIPFCTSASSGLGQSGTLLAELAGTGDWQEGMRFRSGVAESDVTDWLRELGLTA